MLLWKATAAAPLFKNPDFFEEDEWRLIHLAQTPWDVRFKAKPTGIVPFVEIGAGLPQSQEPERIARLKIGKLPDLLPITIVWSGPGSASETSMFLAARVLLENYKYVGVGLRASQIPFRVG
jgi:hypothetical protein